MFTSLVIPCDDGIGRFEEPKIYSKVFWRFSHSDSMKSKHPVFVHRLFAPLNQEVAIKYFKRVVCAVFFSRAHGRR